ncbi:unnamed protein product [Brassicogethes aeneus]|uniref:Ribonuclease P protein subunit p29 n=1 Tax=Brassicogethes aeneus TaxID=1431903 RepID=A0A9P0ATG3_BRAAE|nr:unnamed protein product [Brassicogethes aeneus]
MDLRGFVHQELPPEIVESNVEGGKFMNQFMKTHIPHKDITRDGSNFRFLLHKFRTAKKIKRKGVKKTFLTRKERRELEMLKLPKAGWNYNSLQSIRNMWREYMTQNLDLCDTTNKIPKCTDSEWTAFSTILAKSELVGAELEVVRSKTPSLVGMIGTLVLETKMTLQIVTKDNKLKIVPKECSVFEFRLNNMKFTVFGKQIMTKPSERSAKKIKGQMYPDL